MATLNLSPYLASGEGIVFALFPQGKTNFLVIQSSIDFMSFMHLLSTNRVMSIYETSVVRFCVLVALVHSNVKTWLISKAISNSRWINKAFTYGLYTAMDDTAKVSFYTAIFRTEEELEISLLTVEYNSFLIWR